MADLLYVEDLTVSFDGFLALHDLGLIVDDRERIRLLIGPNGAGKTTLFDVLSGHVQPMGGRVLFKDSVNLLGRRPDATAHLGVARKFQTPSVFPDHSITENLVLAAGGKDLRATLGSHGSQRVHDRIVAVLDQVGLLSLSNTLAGALSHGQQQWLEIAMLLVQDPALLLLDEPVAGMTRVEKERTADLLHDIVAGTTCTIMLIEHDMEFVRQVAGRGYRVTVLHEGAVLSEGSLQHVQSDERVVKAYLGRGQLGKAVRC
jgi:urea transport system ATP-binding protein